MLLEPESLEFEELSPKVRQNAVSRLVDHLNEILDLGGIAADWKHELEEAGYLEPCILYSLGHCQGDGVCFTARPDVAVLARRLHVRLQRPSEAALGKYSLSEPEMLLHFAVNMEHHGHYVHRFSVDITAEYFGNLDGLGLSDAQADRFLARLLERVKEDYMAFCIRFEEEGYDEIEHLTCEEAAADYAAANDVRFTPDGEPVW